VIKAWRGKGVRLKQGTKKEGGIPHTKRHQVEQLHTVNYKVGGELETRGKEIAGWGGEVKEGCVCLPGDLPSEIPGEDVDKANLYHCNRFNDGGWIKKGRKGEKSYC